MSAAATTVGVEEKPLTCPSLDELPYFTEKFPGKVCCLCNLSERSALGQGEILQLKVPYSLKTDSADRYKNEDSLYSKLKNNSKHKALVTGESTYELDKIGHVEIFPVTSFFDNDCIYVHRMCVMWSLRKRISNTTEDFDATHFLTLLGDFLEQKCDFCGQYGASITCKMNCRRVHHWPCAAAAGCLLILESFTVFCAEHLSQVPLICSDNNVECLTCSSLGDLSKLIMCSTCGDHFHSTCIGLTNLPDTRSGWNCARCTKCQICRQEDSNDIRYVKCEQCQKIYHAMCMRPTLSSIPKYGWKCNRCRVCTDCGSRTPGGGSSSRWHSHYTICDSCYQQRNKGFSCPICQKAYRAAAYKEMVKCSWCHKFVHSFCDEEADLTAYHKKKENNPDYDYVCPNCKNKPVTDPQALESMELPLGESQMSELTNFRDMDIDPLEGKAPVDLMTEESQKLPSSKKKTCLGSVRGKGGKFVLQRVGSLSQIGRKRSARGKGRQIVVSGSTSDRFVSRNVDADFSGDKKMLLCSVRDKFILNQDICVMCGSLGIESDSDMISCAQCGQCYHPYCASVKPSKGMLQKGWRCLDCTVCEGCGKKNDEARLLLCDECDISYHIYCVNPPLENVPHGNWKCTYCTTCQACGRIPTGKIDYNDTNSSDCPSCASQVNCFVCSNPYVDGEMIIQCEQCEHWLHFNCDTINTTRSIEYYDEHSYQCLKCRNSKMPQSTTKQTDETVCSEEVDGANKHLPQLNMETKNISTTAAIAADRSAILGNDLLENSEAIHWIDGVCLSENGLNMIKSLSTEIKRKRKMRQAIGNSSKDPLLDSALMEEAQSEKYKDGMIWDGSEPMIPEGFTIFTNESGVTILRKKRQRNLQKLGIGGFSVRNRALKKDNDDAGDQLNSMMLMDKKKKIIRKKQKNKLIEAYPAYLQEAFFGKPLLECGEPVTYDSESSDEIDTSMKVYFTSTSSNNKKTIDEVGGQMRITKKIRNENVVVDNNKQLFVDQFPMVTTPQKGTNNHIGESPIFDIINTTGSTNNGVTKGLSELDGTNSVVNFISSTDNMEKSMPEPGVVIMENYHVPQQVPQEQKFTHSQLYLPGNIISNPTQLHYQQQQQQQPQQQQQQQQQEHKNIPNKLRTQTVVAKIDMQNENRIVEGGKPPNGPAMDGMNVGTQKTAEKMRKDEDLGLMATISAVLYANTEHSNLKELFPNWNDRCKQILKRWRSLSNEKKAPFLQKAKDNRSALRQRREQNKICIPPPKPQKQEDPGRSWKHHEVKIKEEPSNMFVNFNDMTSCYVNPVPHTPNQVQSHVNENFIMKPTLQRPLSHTNSASPTMKMLTSDNQLEIGAAYGSEEIGDKKLRNLLQKPNSEPMLMGSNSDLFLHNDVLRLGLMSSAPLTQNNPMLSLSGKPQQTELRQNMQELDQDVKNQPDLKITDSQEGMSSTAVELENVGFGDILGGLGEGDDDDLLKSLTSEIGDDFNILEYGDPELDVNGLNALDFDENDKGSS